MTTTCQTSINRLKRNPHLNWCLHMLALIVERSFWSVFYIIVINRQSSLRIQSSQHLQLKHFFFRMTKLSPAMCLSLSKRYWTILKMIQLHLLDPWDPYRKCRPLVTSLIQKLHWVSDFLHVYLLPFFMYIYKKN